MLLFTKNDVNYIVLSRAPNPYYKYVMVLAFSFGAVKLINIFEFIMMLMCHLCTCPFIHRDLFGVILVIYYEMNECSRKIKYENMSKQLNIKLLTLRGPEEEKIRLSD